MLGAQAGSSMALLAWILVFWRSVMGHPPSIWTAPARWALLACWVWATPPALAQTEAPLGLEEAVAAALERTRIMAAADAAAQSARELAVAAGQRPDPQLRWSLDNLPVNGPDRFSTTRDFMTMRSVSIMQTLPSNAKRQARIERQLREVDAVVMEREQRLAALRAEVGLAWLDRLLRERRTDLLQLQVDQSRALVQGTEAAHRSGRVPLTEVLSARAALAQQEQSLLLALAERTQARRNLARFTGQPPDQPLAEAALWRQKPIGIDSSELGQRLPDLAAMQAREGVAQAEAEVARQELRPDWSVEVTYSQRGPQYSNMASIAVSVPLPWDRAQRQQRELAARLLRVNELQAEREEQTRDRLLQVQQWEQEWRSGLEQLDWLDARRKPLVQQHLDAALAEYRGGRAALTTVLQARQDALTLELERAELERSTAGAWTRLRYLITEQPAKARP